MAVKNKEDKIGDALLKVALGYQVAEVTEEYAEVDGELKLTKKKKTKKDIPPDLKAVQLLLSSEGGGEYSSWSDEELEAEKQRLLASLNEAVANNKKEKVGLQVKTVVKRKRSVRKTQSGASASKKKTTGKSPKKS